MTTTTMQREASPWWLCDWTPGRGRKVGRNVAHVCYAGEEHKLIGSATAGPVEQEAWLSLVKQAQHILDAQQRKRETDALATAREYDRLYGLIGFYAVDVVCEAHGITREEFRSRLALANMAEEWAA